MKILVVNAGSSSLKYQLIDSESEAVLAKGLCERIGIAGSAITHQAGEGDSHANQHAGKDGDQENNQDHSAASPFSSICAGLF